MSRENRRPGLSLSVTLPGLFLLGRLALLAALPYDAIPGYGDYWNFFYQAGLGRPFFDFWTEFPPLFPFLSRLLYNLVGGRPAAYEYGLALLLTLVQAVNVWLVLKISSIVLPGEETEQRTWAYLILTVGLFYSWAYFDSLAVFFLLLGLYLVLTERDFWAVLALGFGGLTKWFPLLLLPALWKVRSWKRALAVTLGVLVIVALVWSGLYLADPDLTKASLISQGSKGSWETIWALIDGNLATGNFSPEIDRLDPSSVNFVSGNPAVISSWLTLGVFGAIGLFLLLRVGTANYAWLVAFLGVTMVIFFLWSPGYSPQWLLFLLPLLLVSLEFREGLLFAAVLILVHLLEWPLLLSRGYFWSLWLLVPLRTVLFALLGIRFYQAAEKQINLGKGAGHAN